MMSSVYKYFKENLSFLIMAFVILTSGTIIIPNTIFYLVTVAIIGIMKLRMGNFTPSNAEPFLLFLLACFVSTLYSFQIDYRIFVFSAIIIISAPFVSTPSSFLFQRRLCITILFMFPLISLVCGYCYLAGINAFRPEYLKEGIPLDKTFSAIFPHPMWLGPVPGIANVVLLWGIFNVRKLNYKIVLAAVLLMSIFVCVVSGSRSAFFASVIAMGIVLIINLNNMRKILTYGMIIGVLIMVLFPFYFSHSSQMQDKFENGKHSTYGSRTYYIVAFLKHFWDSPIIGSGFATAWYGDKLVFGRLESGGGWMSILSQLGLFGASVMLAILYKTKQTLHFIRIDHYLQLFVVSFIYICLHSFFEGYILTIGYYIGFVFWLLLGHLYSYTNMVSKIGFDNMFAYDKSVKL